MFRNGYRHCLIGATALAIFFLAAAHLQADDDAFAPIAKSIQQSVLTMGYPQSTADDFVNLVRPWNCEQHSQKLAEARASASAQPAEVARAETETLQWLYKTIAKEIASGWVDSKYYYLPYVLRDKHAQCLGYTQLMCILGNAVGLSIKPIDVLETDNNARVGHVACMVNLSNGQVVMVDLQARDLNISNPFDFKQMFTEDGNFWERKKIAGREIPRRIQILDEKGLACYVYCNMAHGYLLANNPEKAIPCLNKAIEFAPNLAMPYNTRGAAFLRLKRAADALADFDKSTELSPKFVLAYTNRAQLFSQLGQSKEAVADYTKAIEIDPGFVDDYVGRGAEYIAQGKLPEAIHDLNTALDIDPRNFGAYLARAAAYRESDKYPQSLHDLDNAIQLKPKSQQAYCSRGKTHDAMKQYDQALTDFNKAIELDPNYAPAYLERGITDAQLGKPDDARTSLRKAAQLDPMCQAQIKQTSEKFNLGL